MEDHMSDPTLKPRQEQGLVPDRYLSFGGGEIKKLDWDGVGGKKSEERIEPPSIEATGHSFGGFYARGRVLMGDALEKSNERISPLYAFPPPPPAPPPQAPETTPTIGRSLNRQHSFNQAPLRTSIGGAPPMAVPYPPAYSSTTARPDSSNHRGLKFRSHSISVTNPVCRSAYESIGQSPAASFLAQFAVADDWKRQPKLEDGSVLDRYRLGRVIGRGSFSECREASYVGDSVDKEDQKLAMKIVKSDEDHGQNLEEFDRELAIWQRLRHRNILPLIDCLRLDNALVAVSPIAENGTLIDYITKHQPFSEKEACPLFRQICEAVAHMHRVQGVVHRDLKLDNILLDDQLRPYVCDFGLSECIDPSGSRYKVPPVELEALSFVDDMDPSETSTSRTRTEDEIFCKGSLWYMPPEELEPNLLKDSQGKTKVTEAVCRMKGDVWSLGIVLYAMLMGRLPFSDDFIPRLHISILSADYPRLPETFSKELRDLMNRLLTVDIEQRPFIEDVLQHPWFVKTF